MKIKRNDANGWKRGAGPCSKDYVKFAAPANNFALHSKKEIAEKVDEVSSRNGGFSAGVSR